jgi:DNA repair protein RecO
MKTIVTTGTVLSRINYQEADRILTIITPDQGKILVMARGVRRIKSKLAGGVELFSQSEITFIRGRGDIGTLVSSRLIKHYDKIVKDIDRTMFAYDFLKLINKITEDNSEPEYCALTDQVLDGLNQPEINLHLVKIWADVRLLSLYGHAPSLSADVQGNKLDASINYDFDQEQAAFTPRTDGLFNSNHIKLLRLAAGSTLKQISRVERIEKYIESTVRLTESIRKTQLHV